MVTVVISPAAHSTVATSITPLQLASKPNGLIVFLDSPASNACPHSVRLPKSRQADLLALRHCLPKHAGMFFLGEKIDIGTETDRVGVLTRTAFVELVVEGLFSKIDSETVSHDFGLGL